MAFHDIQFPVDISIGAVSSPMRLVQIVTKKSGFEERNAVWANSRRTFNISSGMRDLADAHTVLSFWEARGGALYGFRFQDPLDWKSCGPTEEPEPTDQVLGEGDGANKAFQLQKTYADAMGSYVRAIRKPVVGTVLIAVDGVPNVGGWTLDDETGIVTFIVAPADGAEVTAGFEFDVPVRFQDQQLDIDVETFELGGAQDINLIEIRT